MKDSVPIPQIRRKSIRSFVIRAGRVTEAQKKALELGWGAMGLDLEAGRAGFQSAFADDKPRVLEIGYGMGQSLLQMAAAEPETNFIGIEVHPPGVGSLILGSYDLVMGEVRLPNLKTYLADAMDVLQECVPEQSLARIQIYFPDPWHKKKHHKRRLVQTPLVALMASRLAPGGLLHLATDWVPYAEQMHEVLSAEPLLLNTSTYGDYVPRPDWRPQTRFESRGERLGHEVRDLVYRRSS